MTTEISVKEELIKAVGAAISEFVALMSSLDEQQVNTVPYKDSWTAGQLFRHVTKSINGMAGAMGKEGIAAGRDPGERIDGLRKAFLDFSNKMKSPEFIVPEPGPYDKQSSIDELTASFELLKKNTVDIDLAVLLHGLPLGEITKLELLHFVVYHTQRHLHQMQKIAAALHG